MKISGRLSGWSRGPVYFRVTHSSKEMESRRMVKVQVNGPKGHSIIVIGQK